jgi:hypothetical protein
MVFGVEEEGSASEEGGDGDEVEGVFGDDDGGEEVDFQGLCKGVGGPSLCRGRP